MRNGVLTQLAAIRREAADEGLADVAEAVDVAILVAAKAQLDAACAALEKGGVVNGGVVNGDGGDVEGAGRDRGTVVTHPRFVGAWRRH